IDELVRAVAIALGSQQLSVCSSIDANSDGQVTVDELVKAVNAALSGCVRRSHESPTRTLSHTVVAPTRTVTSTQTGTPTSPGFPATPTVTTTPPAGVSRRVAGTIEATTDAF